MKAMDHSDLAYSFRRVPLIVSAAAESGEVLARFEQLLIDAGKAFAARRYTDSIQLYEEAHEVASSIGTPLRSRLTLRRPTPIESPHPSIERFHTGISGQRRVFAHASRPDIFAFRSRWRKAREQFLIRKRSSANCGSSGASPNMPDASSRSSATTRTWQFSPPTASSADSRSIPPSYQPTGQSPGWRLSKPQGPCHRRSAMSRDIAPTLSRSCSKFGRGFQRRLSIGAPRTGRCPSVRCGSGRSLDGTSCRAVRRTEAISSNTSCIASASTDQADSAQRDRSLPHDELDAGLAPSSVPRPATTAIA
jgi:hypothetical protein